MKKLFISSLLIFSLSTVEAQSSYRYIDQIVVYVVKLVKPSTRYRQVALSNAPKMRGGWVTDPYSGRKCRRSDAHADHIWPKSKGGPNYSWNLIMSCAEDNIRKSNKIGIETMQGYMEKIKQSFFQ